MFLEELWRQIGYAIITYVAQYLNSGKQLMACKFREENAVAHKKGSVTFSSYNRSLKKNCIKPLYRSATR
jgi:hypothetical protein